jgi:hypothetical protein
MKRVLIAAGILALFGASVGQVRADLIVNGGFETGNFAGWTQGGNTGFTSVVTSPVHSGNFAASMGPVGSDGTLSQNIATQPGFTYTESFWVRSDGGTPNDFTAFVNGTPFFSQTNIPASGFTEHTFNFTATGTSTNISFAFRNDPGFLGLDDVSVVPEPASLLLFGASGLFAAAYAGLRRRTAVPA